MLIEKRLLFCEMMFQVLEVRFCCFHFLVKFLLKNGKLFSFLECIICKKVRSRYFLSTLGSWFRHKNRADFCAIFVHSAKWRGRNYSYLMDMKAKQNYSGIRRTRTMLLNVLQHAWYFCFEVIDLLFLHSSWFFSNLQISTFLLRKRSSEV